MAELCCFDVALANALEGDQTLPHASIALQKLALARKNSGNLKSASEEQS